MPNHSGTSGPRAEAVNSAILSSRRLHAMVVTVLLAGTVGGFVITRNVVADQNRRVLAERAATVEASLLSSERSVAASLRVLGVIAASPGPDALQIFNRVATTQLDQAVAVGAVRVVEGRAVVVAGVGDAAAGKAPSPGLAGLIARARGQGAFVAGLIPNTFRLGLALAVGDVVVFQETSLAPPVGQGSGADSPFGDLDVAIYPSAGENGPPLFATAELPFTGDTVSRPIRVGADTWLLVLASERSLVGAFTERVPWIILAAGLVTTLLLATVVAILRRRRTYALHLVAERTADLEEAHRFQESLLQSGPVVVSRISFPYRAVTYVSPNVSRVLDVQPTATGHHDVAARVHIEDQPAVTAAVARVASGESAEETVEFRIRTDSGVYRWVSDLLVPDEDPRTGSVTAVLSYVTDVDDRKRAELELRDARLAAETANRAKSEFLSRMSHELRTPLTAILGFSQLLERGALTVDQRKSVSYVLKAGRHLLAMIDELLDIARIEAGAMSMSIEPVDVTAVVAETVELTQPQAAAHGVHISFGRASLVSIQALVDAQRLKQILLNLLSNAIKYNVPEGSVTVTVERAGSHVRVSVTDTGPGLDDEQVKSLFVPFQRLGAERGPVEGTGIGLALSRHLAEGMGGRLEAASSPGQGATFWVDVPEAGAAGSRAGSTPAVPMAVGA